jgi:mannitol 2-dehydrogenase
MPVELRRETLAQLAAPVRVPRYDPANVTSGIVHLGLGNFHRAHMARYNHELMERDERARAFGITGVGLQAIDEANIATLARQNGLYTLVERSGSDETVSIIGSIARPLYAGADTGALLGALDDPAIRIVSLTVTENGYCLNASTRRLDPEHPLIRQDLASPERPKSAIGVIVEAYRRRMASGAPAFTALTCDNIQHNGNVLREAVTTLGSLRGVAGLASWIEDHGSFPNTMVDRITPRTAPEDVAYLTERYGVGDGWPVFAETFTQWVIEDQFVAGRPAWEEVGAQFVPDVTPYEIMKLRLLNGSHLAVAALGRLAAYTFVHETMANPLFTRFMAALMDRELGPTLPPVPGIDLDDYKRTLIARFANPAIRDTVERVNTDAPLNVLVVPIEARLKMGGNVDLLALALAGWMRRVRGVDEQSRPIDVRHPLAAELRRRAEEGGADPMPLLGMTQLFGDLGKDDRLVGPLRHWLGRLYAVGSLATLQEAAQKENF